MVSVLLKFQEQGQNGPKHFRTDYIGSPPSLQIILRRAFSWCHGFQFVTVFCFHKWIILNDFFLPCWAIFFYNNCIRERSYFLTSFCICLPTFHAWKVCIISKMFFHNFLFGLRVLNISWMLNVRLVFTTPLLRHMQWPIIIGNDVCKGRHKWFWFVDGIFIGTKHCVVNGVNTLGASSLLFSIFFHFLFAFFVNFSYFFGGANSALSTVSTPWGLCGCASIYGTLLPRRETWEDHHVEYIVCLICLYIF